MLLQPPQGQESCLRDGAEHICAHREKAEGKGFTRTLGSRLGLAQCHQPLSTDDSAMICCLSLSSQEEEEGKKKKKVLVSYN